MYGGYELNVPSAPVSLLWTKELGKKLILTLNNTLNRKINNFLELSLQAEERFSLQFVSATSCLAEKGRDTQADKHTYLWVLATYIDNRDRSIFHIFNVSGSSIFKTVPSEAYGYNFIFSFNREKRERDKYMKCVKD